MPFYEYKCNECSLIFEIQKGMNDSATPLCPSCNSSALRIFSIPITIRSNKDILDTAGSEQGGNCSTCSSGVCSSCGG